MDMDKLIDKAKTATGLDDLGEDSFRDGLTVLIKSLNTQAGLNDHGKVLTEASIVGSLSNRLQIEHWYALHPEIDEQEIVAPLIGLALPRTGSTALACTLAEDPQARSLLMWEGQQPCPPPERETYDTDPRIAAHDAMRPYLDQFYPRLKTMVPLGAQTIAECHPLMAMDFKCQEFAARARIPDYVHWMLHEADLVPTYQYVKRSLKLLQWRCPPHRWRLKSPSHMPFVDALNQVFPDAKFWMSHRDITKVVPSAIDVYHELHRPMVDHVDPAFITDTILEWWTIGMRRTLDFRDNGAEDRFVDVQFSEFQRDPEASVERIYAFTGETLSDEARERMRTWRRVQARGKDGHHELDTIAAALDLDAVREQFRFYSERFDEVAA